MHSLSHIYYLPFYFQAVKGTTAEQSGIRCIAYLISNTIGSIFVSSSRGYLVLSCSSFKYRLVAL